MKASEALVLGALLVKPYGGTLFIGGDGNGEDFGCALGMIIVANGHREKLMRGEHLNYLLPSWMLQNHVVLPCKCGHAKFAPVHPWGKIIEPPMYTVDSAIVHLFDVHVCGGDGWTIARIADWLRSVEPAELPALAASLIAKPEPETVIVEIPAESEKPELAMVGT